MHVFIEKELENASLEDGYWSQSFQNNEQDCEERQIVSNYKHRASKTTESLSMLQTYIIIIRSWSVDSLNCRFMMSQFGPVGRLGSQK